jgi:hypothetical protein
VIEIDQLDEENTVTEISKGSSFPILSGVAALELIPMNRTTVTFLLVVAALIAGALVWLPLW